MFNYSLYIIINMNILFNAFVTRKNKYVIIIVCGYAFYTPLVFKRSLKMYLST